ncbi:MAG TPA: DUF6186 family protein [Actinoplanes sp.]|nr:DUF6186 family protein [Actinoplanes sp.]
MTPRAAIIAGFAAIVLLVVAVDLVARRTASGVRPLSATLAAALRSPGGRVVVFAAWLWAGWHFLAR